MKKPLFNHLCKQQPDDADHNNDNGEHLYNPMYQALLLGPHLVPTVTEADDRHIMTTQLLGGRAVFQNQAILAPWTLPLTTRCVTLTSCGLAIKG